MLTFKIAAIIIIAAAGIFGGLITLRSSFNSAHTANLNMGNAFAGGVFLGVGFLHMLPDGMDNFSSLNLSGDYPYGLLTVALGFILFFACMTPLGIILGSLLDGLDGGKNSVLFEAVFDTLAAGTFLYIAILEIIAELFEQNTQKTSKLMMIFMGFALMATIAIWT